MAVKVMMAVGQKLGMGRQRVDRKFGREITWKRTSDQNDDQRARRSVPRPSGRKKKPNMDSPIPLALVKKGSCKIAIWCDKETEMRARVSRRCYVLGREVFGFF